MRKGRRYEQVAEQIQRLIASGALSPATPPRPSGNWRRSRRRPQLGARRHPHAGGDGHRRVPSRQRNGGPRSLDGLAGGAARQRARAQARARGRASRCPPDDEPALAARAAANATEEERPGSRTSCGGRRRRCAAGSGASKRTPVPLHNRARRPEQRGAAGPRRLDGSCARAARAPYKSRAAPSDPSQVTSASSGRSERRDGPAAEAAVRKHLKEIEEVVTRQL